VVLLVSGRLRPDGDARIEPAAARRLFGALERVLRQSDHVGWYSDGRVAGAILPSASRPRGPAGGSVDTRIMGHLETVLPLDIMSQFRVRICEVRPGGWR